MVVVLPDPFREMRARWNHTETQQSGQKMEEVVPKMARRRGSDTGQSRRR